MPSLPGPINAIVNRNNAAYHLRRTQDYQALSGKYLKQGLEEHNMPLKMHTKLHIRHDEIMYDCDALDDADNPKPKECRELKQRAKILHTDARRSSQRAATNCMWALKDNKLRKQPETELDDELYWSNSGLPVLTRNSAQLLIDGDSDGEDSEGPFTESSPPPPPYPPAPYAPARHHSASLTPAEFPATSLPSAEFPSSSPSPPGLLSDEPEKMQEQKESPSATTSRTSSVSFACDAVTSQTKRSKMHSRRV